MSLGRRNFSVDQALVDEIRVRYLHVMQQVAAAARSAGREPASVRLVTVTKTHPLETVRAVIAAGARDLGENYAEEALEKIQAVGAVDGLRWHMIGHVQGRKAELVAAHFELLHSLDSLKLAGRLDRFAGEAGRRLPVLLEVNVSGEASKFGYPAWDEEHWLALREEIRQIALLPNLEIRGLMTMPPYSEIGEESRPFFQRMRSLQVFLQEYFPQVTWNELSMGTSADFTVAIEEGATLVRVGTAILGTRQAAGG
jgi:PLP dependent protein